MLKQIEYQTDTEIDKDDREKHGINYELRVISYELCVPEIS